jgi:rSAM/selenodomain-associated transferase 1
VKELIIIFSKNAILGKVKTRLSSDLGNDLTLKVFNELTAQTRLICSQTAQIRNCDVLIFLSDFTNDPDWMEFTQVLQTGSDLGERMGNAFQYGFEHGYTRIIGVGTDLPNLSHNHLTSAFDMLEEKDVVFGPSSDGGYYLIGLRELQTTFFRNIAWSTDTVLDFSLDKAKKSNLASGLLIEENDIDTLQDLLESDWLNKTSSELKKSINNTILKKGSL